MYEYQGISFDDVVEDEYSLWSQVCPECARKFNFPERMLDDAGSGICGVKGCSNESDYYIDFKVK